MKYLSNSVLYRNGCQQHPDCFSCPLPDCSWEATQSQDQRWYRETHGEALAEKKAAWSRRARAVPV